MMKRKIKRIFKLFLAAFAFVGLLGMGGLWRLAVAPLHITKSSPIMQYVPDYIQFDALYLGVGQFYMIPELELTNVAFRQDHVSVQAPKLYATWKISHLLSGDFKVSSVRLVESTVKIELPPEGAPNPRTAASSPSPDQVLSEVVGAFSRIPVKYLELSKARLILPHGKKTYTFSDVYFYALQLSRYINAQLQGHFSSEKTNPFFLLKAKIDRGNLDVSGQVEINRLIPAHLPFERKLQEKAAFFKQPVSLSFVYNFYPHTKDFYINGKTVFYHEKNHPLNLYVKAERTKQKDLSVELTAPSFSIKDIESVWYPHEDNIRPWVVKSILEGGVKNFSLRLLFEKTDQDWVFSDVHGNMELDKITLRYQGDLPPVSHITGKVYFDKSAVWGIGHRALYRGVQFSKIQIKLSGLDEAHLHFDGGLQFTGPFSDIIAYLNHGFLKKHLPQNLKATSGDIRGDFHLSLPLKKRLSEEDIIFETQMTLERGACSLAYNGRTLRLQDANVHFKKNQDEMIIDGSGDVDGFKSTFKMEDDYRKDAKIKSRKKIQGAGKAQGLIDVLPPSIGSFLKVPETGDVQVDFLSESDGDDSDKIKIDVDTQKTALSVPVLNWQKKAGAPGRFQMDLETQKGFIKSFKKLSFISPGLNIVGQAQLRDTGKISGILLSPFLIKGQKGSAEAELRDGIWHVGMRVPFLNLNPIILSLRRMSDSLPSHAKHHGVSFNLDLMADLLFLKPEYGYKDFRAQMKFRDGDVYWMKARGKDEEDPLLIRYQPHQENMVLEIDIPRLETLLDGLDITKNIRGRRLQIQGQKPLKNMDQPIKGKLFIERVHILKAPAFAKLLSLISIEGLLTGLAEKGLVFNDNYASFEYKNQNVALRRAYMMNSSIGITAKGYLHFGEKNMDLEGVLVPANFINQLLGHIPIIGQILSGGKDQGIFSVSYAAKGSLKEPKISSNPLGVMAPNLIKGLFSRHHSKPSLTTEGKDATKLS